MAFRERELAEPMPSLQPGRWKTAGGQAVLTLRSLAKSSRWDPAMAIVLPTWRKPVHEVA